MIKGCKSIAEYSIRQWMERENFPRDYFELTVDGRVGVIRDYNGDELKLIYDPDLRQVYVEV